MYNSQILLFRGIRSLVVRVTGVNVVSNCQGIISNLLVVFLLFRCRDTYINIDSFPNMLVSNILFLMGMHAYVCFPMRIYVYMCYIGFDFYLNDALN